MNPKLKDILETVKALNEEGSMDDVLYETVCDLILEAYEIGCEDLLEDTTISA